MSSKEYYKCMSELYFGRMLLWLLYILIISIAEHCGMISFPIVHKVLGGLLAVDCGVKSFLEYRRAND